MTDRVFLSPQGVLVIVLAVMARLPTLKQRTFAQAFVGEANGNGTEACRIAKYAGSDSALGKQAFDNLRNPKIIALIADLRAEAESKASDHIMSATEVLVGLTRFALADPADLYELDGSFDIQKAKERGVSRLIKAINFDKDTGKMTRIELHNAHAATVDMGKHYKLFTDKVEHSVLFGEAFGKLKAEFPEVTEPELKAWFAELVGANAQQLGAIG